MKDKIVKLIPKNDRDTVADLLRDVLESKEVQKNQWNKVAIILVNDKEDNEGLELACVGMNGPELIGFSVLAMKLAIDTMGF